MEKKKWVKLAGFAMLVLLSLFLCVGCADNGVEDSDEVTYIDFGRESASSRGIESWNESLYPPESLYWTYTATKIRGNYTTGQTNGEEKAVVKNGPAQGLGTVGPFSVGVWRFELFGYYNCVEDTDGKLKFTDLVYTGKTGIAENGYTTTIDKRPATTPETPMQQIIFELSPNDTFSGFAKGVLELKNMYLNVPEGQRFTTDPSVTTVVRVTVSDVTSGSPGVEVAVSTTNVTDEIKESGRRVDLDAFVFASAYQPVAKFDTGITKLEFKAEYKDVFTGSADATQYTDGWAEIGTIATYPIAFTAGVKTTLSGDINDIEVKTDAYSHKAEYDWAVAKITWTSANDNPDGTGVNYSVYTSLDDAVTAYVTKSTVVSSTKNYVELLADLTLAETVTVGSDVPVYMAGHFAEDITLSGSGVLTLKMATDNTRDYKVSGDGFKVNSVKPEEKTESTKYVWLTTTGTGTVEVTDDVSDAIWHTGSAGTVKVVASKYVDTDRAKGYHLGTDKDGAATVTKVGTVELTTGNLEIGGCTTVESLVAKGTYAKVWGKKNSVVNAYKYDSTVLKAKDTAAAALTTSNTNAKTVFKEIVLDGNSGKTASSTTKAYVYGIDGMNVVLPKNVFTFGAIVQLGWNTKNDGTGVFYGNTFNNDIISSTADADASGNHLYAVLDKHPVGGIVYFIRCSNLKAEKDGLSDTLSGTSSGTVVVDGVTYTFYDTNGAVLDLSSNTYQLKTYLFKVRPKYNADESISMPAYEPVSDTLLTALGNAVYYTVSETPEYDHFFVRKNTGLLALKYGNGDSCYNISGMDDMSLGGGKNLRDIALNEANRNVALNSYDGKNNTVWAYVDWLNGSDACSKTDTGWASETRVDGCSDWYVPNVTELECMRKSPKGNFNEACYMMSANSILGNCIAWKNRSDLDTGMYQPYQYDGSYGNACLAIRSF